MKKLVSILLFMAVFLSGCGNTGQSETHTAEPSHSPAPVSTPLPQKTVSVLPLEREPDRDILHIVSPTAYAGDTLLIADLEMPVKEMGAIIKAVDPQTQSKKALCSIEGCSHSDEICNAYSKSQLIIDIRGNEYVVIEKDLPSGDFAFYKLPLSGEKAQFMCKGVMRVFSDTAVAQKNSTLYYREMSYSMIGICRYLMCFDMDSGNYKSVDMGEHFEILGVYNDKLLILYPCTWQEDVPEMIVCTYDVDNGKIDEIYRGDAKPSNRANNLPFSANDYAYYSGGVYEVVDGGDLMVNRIDLTTGEKEQFYHNPSVSDSMYCYEFEGVYGNIAVMGWNNYPGIVALNLDTKEDYRITLKNDNGWRLAPIGETEEYFLVAPFEKLVKSAENPSVGYWYFVPHLISKQDYYNSNPEYLPLYNQ